MASPVWSFLNFFFLSSNLAEPLCKFLGTWRDPCTPLPPWGFPKSKPGYLCLEKPTARLPSLGGPSVSLTSTTGWPPSEAASLHTEPPCLAELERIQIQEASKKKPGEGAGLGWAELGRGRGGVPQGPPEAQRLRPLGLTGKPSPEKLGKQEGELPSCSYPHGGTGSPK